MSWLFDSKYYDDLDDYYSSNSGLKSNWGSVAQTLAYGQNIIFANGDSHLTDGQINLTTKSRLVRRILQALKSHSIFVLQTHFEQRNFPPDLYIKFQIGSINVSNIARYIAPRMNGDLAQLKSEATNLLLAALKEYAEAAKTIEKDFRTEKKQYRDTNLKRKGKKQ